VDKREVDRPVKKKDQEKERKKEGRERTVEIRKGD
jgi:hypothetical protein